ncbi:MAG: hypothetical protein O7I93_00560, partial [Gemmatimonadetes bacterium]|nr:hypothetical protein [Gemmatimonadota bacterium]
MPRRLPWPVRLFGLTARVLLPGAFRQEFGAEHLATFADQYRSHRHQGVLPVARFWLREVAGLLATTGREYREMIHNRPHMAARWRRPLQTPKKNWDMLSTLRSDLAYAVRMI